MIFIDFHPAAAAATAGGGGAAAGWHREKVTQYWLAGCSLRKSADPEQSASFVLRRCAKKNGTLPTAEAIPIRNPKGPLRRRELLNMCRGCRAWTSFRCSIPFDQITYTHFASRPRVPLSTFICISFGCLGERSST